jgi:hypothetical protein
LSKAAGVVRTWPEAQTLALDGGFTRLGSACASAPGLGFAAGDRPGLRRTPAHAANWTIVPSIQVNETLTDNLYLSSSSNKTGDLVTGITPGISIKGEGSRAKPASRTTVIPSNSISGRAPEETTEFAEGDSARLRPIEDFFFIDATGTISQQYLSAFGAVSPEHRQRR